MSISVTADSLDDDDYIVTVDDGEKELVLVYSKNEPHLIKWMVQSTDGDDSFIAGIDSVVEVMGNLIEFLSLRERRESFEESLKKAHEAIDLLGTGYFASSNLHHEGSRTYSSMLSTEDNLTLRKLHAQNKELKRKINDLEAKFDRLCLPPEVEGEDPELPNYDLESTER